VAGLPVRPEVYTKLTEAIADPQVEMRQVAQIVTADVGLAAKVLHLTNSSFFGSKRKFVNLEQAVNFIGLMLLRKVVLSAEVFSKFDPKHSLGGLSLEQEQRHGLACAGIARQIAPTPELGDYAFLAGMLHDVGKLVLATRAPKVMRQLTRQKTKGCSFPPTTEVEVTGTTHGRLGAYLLGLWGIEHPIVEAVAHHHDPASVRSASFDLPSIVHVADALVHSIENERAGGSPDVAVDQEHLAALGIADKLEGWRATAQQLWDKCAA
jgi:HD-like signal output (HDOD) protein